MRFREFIEQEAVMLYLHRPDLSLAEISSISGMPVAGIYRALRERLVEPNRRRSNRDNVVAFAGSGLGIGQIAELTGYSPTSVRRILSGR